MWVVNEDARVKGSRASRIIGSLPFVLIAAHNNSTLCTLAHTEIMYEDRLIADVCD